ncbi:MAG: pirin family protein [Thermodesulfovibrionales bacterium]
MAIILRSPESIYQVTGEIDKGTFHGRWHFSFGDYYDPAFSHFGTLRVFNDDTLSPGAVWPLHPHRDNEVVTYCVAGEFRHADEGGLGGLLKKGWVQHTTVGSGLWHSEINNLADKPMRFIQLWFIPSRMGLEPVIQQKQVEREERTDRLLRLVSPDRHTDALPIASDAEVYSCFLREGSSVRHTIEKGRGLYLYVLEGGPVRLRDRLIPELWAAKILDESALEIRSEGDAELLLLDLSLEV